MKTLQAPPPKQIPSSKVLLKAGKEIFEKTGCADCHVPPYYTDAATYHTGIEDEQGNRRFNPLPCWVFPIGCTCCTMAGPTP